jgi:hypothetical protein
MILKALVIDLWNYSKLFFCFVLLFICIQLFYTFRFAHLAKLVDNHKPVPHPIAFEAFPFVVYNMYSGKIEDWNKYSFLKIEVNGKEICLTDLAIIQEDQFINPIQKYLALKAQNFDDEQLHAFLVYTLDSSQSGNSVYAKVSNKDLLTDETKWGNWLKRYLSKTLGQKIKSLKIFECLCGYNQSGRPEIIEQKEVFQFQ